MPTIYVLLCEKKRYYIGKTIRPLQSRIEEHFNSNGSEWTRKYKPLKVIEIIQNADDFDEDKYTKIYMQKYGIDRVRGGSYTQLELPEYSIISLEKELCSVTDTCFRCNRKGHYANNCYATTKTDGSPIYDDSTDDESEYDVYCCEYCHKEFLTEAGAEKHEKICKQNKSNSQYTISCFKCGRKGHYANKCYASFH